MQSASSNTSNQKSKRDS